MKIFILSGPVQTGKTTRLLNWVQNQDSVDGIIAPVIDDKRHLLHLSSGLQKQLEASANEPDNKIVKIGKFRFNTDVFSWACNRLNESISSSPLWLIIDEIGPLELSGKGLAPALTRVLNHPDKIGNLILVIREQLVEQVTDHFQLNRFAVVKFDFPKLSA